MLWLVNPDEEILDWKAVCEANNLEELCAVVPHAGICEGRSRVTGRSCMMKFNEILFKEIK